MNVDPNVQDRTVEETSAELLDGLKTCRSVVENYKSLLDPSHVAVPAADEPPNREIEKPAND